MKRNTKVKPDLKVVKTEKKVCSICQADYVGWGNNAAPFVGRCCDECNAHFVLPARLLRLKNQQGW